jgi:hypothetical protein
VHTTTKLSPFQVVYGFHPRTPIDLLPLPSSETTCFHASKRSKFILKMHETTKLNIKKGMKSIELSVVKVGRK